MKEIKKSLQMSWKEWFYLILGSVIFSIGTHSFVEPANIAPGGVQGVALMAGYLWGFPVGMTTFVLNLPLLVLAWRNMSRRFTIRTALTIGLIAVILDFIVAPICPAYTGDRLISCLYGGVLIGAGLGFVFMSGCTTGGTDILGFFIQKKWQHISIGRALLLVDGVILVLSILVFGNLDAGLFGVITLYAQTKVVDMLLYGTESGTKATIVTGKPGPMVERIISELDRTATILNGKGAFSGADTFLVVCTVRKPEFAQLKKIITETDEKAFMIVSEATQIYGEGFKAFREDL